MICERRSANRQARLRKLIGRYSNPEVANLIVQRKIWKGQTEKQLLDSHGEPANRQRTTADPECETWVYKPRGLSKYPLRIMLNHGCVATWEPRY